MSFADIVTPQNFAGEPYLQAEVPDYGQAQLVLICLLLLSLAFWVVKFPALWSSNKATTRLWSILPLAATGFVLSSIAILFFANPYNVWLSRRVMQVPLLSQQECQDLIARSTAAAERNVHNATTGALLEEPRGWQKTRHNTYPTTDLNLVTDPFLPEDRAHLLELLNRRMAPLLSRLYGVPPASLRCNDMFVVRYDADHRAHLDSHEDDGDISFNLLLNDDFEGGGTRFYRRTRVGAETTELEPFAHVAPTEPGTLLTHSALLQHEGSPITQGTRFILVGFLAVDRTHPWTLEWTGLSWLASFANLNWLAVQTKEDGFNNDHRKRLLLQQQHGTTNRRKKENNNDPWDQNRWIKYVFNHVLKTWVDQLCAHEVVSLVADSDKEAFLRSLDESPLPLAKHNQGAMWFKGQETYLGHRNNNRETGKSNAEL